MRDEAEARLARLESAPVGSIPPDVQRLMHELSVHQIELEMQNEQLRQAQSALEAARTRYFDLYHQAPVAYVMLDPQGRIIECNLNAQDLLRGVASRLVGRPLSDFVVPPAALDFSRRRDQMLAGEADHGFEIAMHRVDRTPFWAQIQMNATPTEDGGGLVTRITITDISQRKRMEDEADRLAAIVRSSGQAIFSQQPSGAISAWNPGAERLFLHPAQDIVGRPLSIILPPERMAEERIDRDRARKGQQFEYETVRLRADGTGIPVSLSVSPILDPTGRITGISYIARDISEDLRLRERLAKVLASLRENEAALKRADRRKDEFIAMLAHELRNPLAPIRNAAATLKFAPNLDPHVEWCRDVIDRQVGHMATLLDDLLDVSRVTRGMIKLHQDRVDLSRAVSHALEITRPLITSRGHTLTVELPSRMVEVVGDLTRLTQVFGNLLNNAAKYTDPGGQIALTVSLQGSEVQVSVKDSGIGMDTAQLPRVFELFAQLDPTADRGQGGLGIGLSLVRALVEMHGGTIQAHSEGQGHGSEFVVTLPVYRSAGVPEAESSPSQGGPPSLTQIGHGCRVLIVDDNEDAAETMALMLSLQGYDVRTAADGQQAIDVAHEYRPHVAILDVGLPRMNGLEAGRRIRQEPWGRDMMLIACTGWGQREDQQRSSEAGFNHHLVKPVDLDLLLTLLPAGPRPDP